MFQLITFDLALVFRKPISTKSGLKLTYIFYFFCCQAFATNNFNKSLTIARASAADQ